MQQQDRLAVCSCLQRIKAESPGFDRALADPFSNLRPAGWLCSARSNRACAGALVTVRSALRCRSPRIECAARCALCCRSPRAATCPARSRGTARFGGGNRTCSARLSCLWSISCTAGAFVAARVATRRRTSRAAGAARVQGTARSGGVTSLGCAARRCSHQCHEAHGQKGRFHRDLRRNERASTLKRLCFVAASPPSVSDKSSCVNSLCSPCLGHRLAQTSSQHALLKGLPRRRFVHVVPLTLGLKLDHDVVRTRLHRRARAHNTQYAELQAWGDPPERPIARHPVPCPVRDGNHLTAPNPRVPLRQH